MMSLPESSIPPKPVAADDPDYPLAPPVPNLPVDIVSIYFVVYADQTSWHGHAFIGLEARRIDGSFFFRQRYGFYPQHAPNNPGLVSTRGVLVDDGKTGDPSGTPAIWDWKIFWGINASQW